MVQQKQIQLGTMKLQVRTLALLRGLRIWRCHELWCRPAATALIRPLVWELPFAVGSALKSKEKKSLNLKTDPHYIQQPRHGNNLHVH